MRLDRAVIVALTAGALLWIEHGHRIDIDTPTGVAFAAAGRSVCPDNENIPYSDDCILFMQGDAAPYVSLRANARAGVPVSLAVTAESKGPACPANNENAPYSARCVQFLTGWFWQPNE